MKSKLTPQEKAILDNLTPWERKELDLAKRLLAALVNGPVYALGGIFYGHPINVSKSLRFSQTDIHDAVRCLQRLGYGIERADAGGSPTWILTATPTSS